MNERQIISNQNKEIFCIYCNKKMVVGKFEPNKQACNTCLSEGKENPDSRTKKAANEARKKTLMKKHGVENAANIKGITEKKKQTNIERYGGIGFASDELADKTKQTLLDKYGVNNIMKSDVGKKHFIGENNPMKRIEVSQKVSESLKGRVSKNKGKNYEEIYGKEKAEGLIIQRRNYFLNKFLDKLKNELDFLNLELIDNIYEGAHILHNWKCQNCGCEFKQIWNSIQQGYLCPTCYPRNMGTSKGEQEVLAFLKEVLPDDIIIIENDRNILKPKELDIVIPSKNIAIEYNGLWFHSESSPNFSDRNYHRNKTDECVKQGIRLIHIFEDEWIHKKEIVKHRLIQILNMSKAIKLNARDCEIREIDSKVKNAFLEEFHIQGSDLSSIKLGAFYHNQLVSVMTFSKGNRAKGVKHIRDDVWELNRFCSDYNFNIRGVAGKILKYFQRNYEWKLIYSYADRRWSNGNLYNQLGFKQDGGPRLNYWYVKGLTRYHRFSLRKRKDEPKHISEKVLRINEGYMIVWDCGNLKFILENN